MTLTPYHLAIIEALAELAAEEYLTAQAAQQHDSVADEAERVLPGYEQAA